MQTYCGSPTALATILKLFFRFILEPGKILSQLSVFHIPFLFSLLPFLLSLSSVIKELNKEKQQTNSYIKAASRELR